MAKQLSVQSKKSIYFDEEEKQLLKYIEQNDFDSLAKSKKNRLINELSLATKNTLAKRKAINLRLMERDLLKFKAKAAEEGIPYQTLMTSILHKYISQ